MRVGSRPLKRGSSRIDLNGAVLVEAKNRTWLYIQGNYSTLCARIFIRSLKRSTSGRKTYEYSKRTTTLSSLAPSHTYHLSETYFKHVAYITYKMLRNCVMNNQYLSEVHSCAILYFKYTLMIHNQLIKLKK